MLFMMLLYSDESGWKKLSRADRQDWLERYAEFGQAMHADGVLIDGNHLQSAKKAKTVRFVKGKKTVSSGPRAAGKEQLAGYFVLDVKNQAAALKWAALCPGAHHGTVELRPLGAPPR
jgi:hypothetical protein